MQGISIRIRWKCSQAIVYVFFNIFEAAGAQKGLDPKWRFVVTRRPRPKDSIYIEIYRPAKIYNQVGLQQFYVQLFLRPYLKVSLFCHDLGLEASHDFCHRNSHGFCIAFLCSFALNMAPKLHPKVIKNIINVALVQRMSF